MKAPHEVLKRGTDYAAGWETGRNRGRKRWGRGLLLDREAPEHFCFERRWNWEQGYEQGLRARHLSRLTWVLFTDPNGELQVKRMGGSHASIVQRLIDSGCTGTKTDGAFVIQTGTGPIHYYGY